MLTRPIQVNVDTVITVAGYIRSPGFHGPRKREIIGAACNILSDGSIRMALTKYIAYHFCGRERVGDINLYLLSSSC